MADELTCWEKAGDGLYRQPVPGGWVYKAVGISGGIGLCFVPAAAESKSTPTKTGDHASTPGVGPINCNIVRRLQGQAYPRTCGRCGLSACPFYEPDGTPKGRDHPA